MVLHRYPSPTLNKTNLINAESERRESLRQTRLHVFLTQISSSVFVLLLLSHLPPFHLLHHSFALLSVSLLASFLSHPVHLNPLCSVCMATPAVSFTLLWWRSSV